MRVLIADKLPASAVKKLEALSFTVSNQPDVKGDALAAALRETQADAVVVRSTKVTAPMLEAGNLGLVIRAGSGYDTIDIAAASRSGIYVANCPGKNAAAVAELAWGLILSLDRRIPDNVADLRAGVWKKKEYGKARGLMGRTLGLVGVGQIGRLMIERARGFGMPVVAWSRSLTPERAAELGIERKASPEEVAAASDVVSVHVSLTPDTKKICGEKFFAAMQKNAYFINTSRGGTVDQAALEKAAKEKGIRAGLDVFASEPGAGDDRFEDGIAQTPGVYGTHHIGASTDEAQETTAEEAIRILATYRDTGHVPNVVNLCHHSPSTHLLVVRHRDRVGVLAHVLDELRAAGINVQEMENVVFDGAEAAIARIHLDGAPGEDALEKIQSGNEHILALHLIAQVN